MIVSLDLSTTFVGVASRSTAGLALQAIRCAKGPGMNLGPMQKQVWGALDALHQQEPITAVVVEVAPRQFGDDDSGRAEVQAAIGFALGRAAMIGECWAYLHGIHVRFVPNGDWRVWVRDVWARTVRDPRTSTRARAPTAQPPRRDGSGFVMAFAGCDHTWRAPDLYALQKRPDHCPMCSGSNTAAPDRMAHKALWVDIAARAWPAEVEVVAAPARARAKKADRPLHQLAGVADACDAALMLQYAISNPEASP